jgi:hypothetical protein
MFGATTIDADVDIRQNLSAKKLTLQNDDADPVYIEFDNGAYNSEIRYDGEFSINAPVRLVKRFNTASAIHAFLTFNGTSDNLFDILNSIDNLGNMPISGGISEYYGCNIDCIALSGSGGLVAYLNNGVTWTTSGTTHAVLRYIEKVSDTEYIVYGNNDTSDYDSRLLRIRAIQNNSTEVIRSAIGTIG